MSENGRGKSAAIRAATLATLLLLLAVLVGSAANAASVQQGVEPRLSANIDIDLDNVDVHVGDRIRLTLAVEHDAEASVRWPESIDPGSFELIEAQAQPPVALPERAESVEGPEGGRRVRSTAELVLAPFELGELEIPSIDVVVVGADASETTLSSNVFGVVVASVGLDEDGDIRNLRGPRSIERRLLLLWPWAVSLLVLALATWWLWRWLAARKQSAAPEVAAPTAPTRPAHEVTLEALAALETSSLLQRGELKEYYTRASEIVRVYIEGQFQVAALEETTSETMRDLAALELSGEILGGFGRLLDESDLVKFAKHRPSDDACRRLTQEARHLVEATRAIRPAVRAVEDPGAVGAGGDAQEIDMAEAIDGVPAGELSQ